MSDESTSMPFDRASWDAVARSPFVSLGTYRRNGDLVSVPVWIAPDGDDLVVTSERGTGKVKRLRNDDRVVMRPCGRLGKVQPGAPTARGVGRVVGSPDVEVSASRALGRKYGWQYRVILGFERLMRRIQRRDGERVILRVSARA
jgi:PPOX class probable F420-dependent enzyme